MVCDFLLEYCNRPFVSGFEQMTPDLLPKYFMPFSDTYENDRRGSYIFSKKGETSRSVMLEAHVDELGFMITEVMADGFLRFSPVGYYNTLCLECQDVVIYGKKEVPGVICARPDKPQDAKNIICLYISGIDTRGSEIINTRSDVNIIATINTDTKQMLLVSTPRDYFVPLSISNGQKDKLTHAGIYGINVCMDTLGMLYNEDINYYFRINFAGFEQLINALGGVTVNSDYEFDSKNIIGYHYNKGENFLNGEQALVFSRERYAFSEGDRQRGKNQMAVIKGVINKALSPELLKNYSSVLSSIQGCFETNISYEEIARLLQQQLNNGGSWNIVSYSVDGTGDTQKPYSMSQNAYVMIPDESTVQKAQQMMKKVRDGEPVSQEEADAGTSTSAASDNEPQATSEGAAAVAQDNSTATDVQTAEGTVQQ